jgi:ATP-binding cassette subfamily F protein 3
VRRPGRVGYGPAAGAARGDDPIIVYLDHVTHGYGSQLVLEDISWEIEASRKIGLVGPNGAGKSTLLRIIADRIRPDAGIITRQRGLRIGYLAQEPELDARHTVWEEVTGAASALTEIRTVLQHLEAQMAEPAVYEDADKLQRVLDAHVRAEAEFAQLGGYQHESRVRQVLSSLGFAESDWGLSTAVLSGGERKLVGLAKLLVTDRDLLLLDEPDNHLDLEHKAFLESIIRGFEGTVIIVSHDRYLLDETVDVVAEVEDHRLTLYQGNYSAYAVEKQLRLLRQQQQYAAQRKEIARIEAAIARFEYWASVVVNERHARQARSRRKMLERMDKVERPVLERRKMGLELGGWRGSQKVLEIVGLVKSFPQPEVAAGEHVVLAGIDLLIWHGERVGLLGANGVGKSLLFRCILGTEIPTHGIAKIGPSVRTGYYAQEHETLDPNRTLIEEARQVRPMYEEEAVAFLGRFLFPYRLTRNRVRELSGGERSRLQFAKLMLSEPNFLLLDEPTNNLDLPSCEVLENALDEFEGTLLVISHDRYFLDRVVERIVELEDGRLAEFPGNYTYYREEKARRAQVSR